MLDLNYIRDLTLSTPVQVGRPNYLAAASGLVKVGNYLYVVGDDENHLGVFKANSNEAGTLIRLLEGDLPLEYEARKAAKADFEVLLALPSFAQYPQGALLALGSGSKKTRRWGVLLSLDSSGQIQGTPTIINLEPLYKALKESFEVVNIEGAFIQDNNFYLLQRGNKAVDAGNALIQLDLATVLNGIAQDQIIHARALKKITPYTIGMIKDVPLCFTDAVALPNGGWLFSAAAEATDNAYNDGEYLGGAIGIVNTEGTIIQLGYIDTQYKVEGIHANLVDNTLQLLLVTDADNASVPAKLLSTQIILKP